MNHILYYDGVCNPLTGECLYDEEVNSIECGYVSPEGKNNNGAIVALAAGGVGLGLLFGKKKDKK